MSHSKKLFLVFVVLGLLALVGCDGGNDAGDAPAAFDVTGRWIGSFQSNGGGVGNITIDLQQSENSVTGDFTTTATSGGFFSCSPGTIDATVSGDDFNGTIVHATSGGGGSTDFDGTIASDGNSISGTYDTNGGLCDGDTGTFDINRT